MTLFGFTTYTHAGAHIAVRLVNNPGYRQRALAMLASYDIQQPANSAGQVRDAAASRMNACADA